MNTNHKMIFLPTERQSACTLANLWMPYGVPSVQLIANISQVPQRSPFRYPGGKTWLTPALRAWLSSLSKRPRIFLEPFAGGASASLLVAFEDWCREIYFADKDPEVAIVWQCILSKEGPAFADAVRGIAVNEKNVNRLIAKKNKTDSLIPQAVSALIRNRIQRGGILAPGAGRLRSGESGRGIASRWYPETLATRLAAIHKQVTRLNFIKGDGIDLLERFSDKHGTAAFIDPPYFKAAKRLYPYWEINHRKLFELLRRFRGDFLLAYDDAREVRDLAAEFDLRVAEIPMRTTSHRLKNELLISRHLKWLDHTPPRSGQANAASVQRRTRCKTPSDSLAAA